MESWERPWKEGLPLEERLRALEAPSSCLHFEDALVHGELRRRRPSFVVVDKGNGFGSSFAA